VIDELFADDFVATIVGAPEQIRGPQGFREFVVMYRTAFPDLRITVDEQFAEGETSLRAGRRPARTRAS
jgi:predicted ester cyclase